MANIDPLKNFSFKVQRLGLNATDFAAGFLNVQGLSRKVDVIKYRTGSDGRYSRKLSGLVEYDPITFEQGIILGNHDLWNLTERVFSASSAELMTGTVGEQSIKEDIAVILMQAGGTDVAPGANAKLSAARAWHLYGTWVSSFTVSNFDANASDVAKMTCVVECDYWEEVQPGSLSDAITVIA